eukprot:13419784-Alexandrium_andersonii.AAC.1
MRRHTPAHGQSQARVVRRAPAPCRCSDTPMTPGVGHLRTRLSLRHWSTFPKPDFHRPRSSASHRWHLGARVRWTHCT